MSEFKKQAIVWALTIAIAVATIGSANSISDDDETHTNASNVKIVENVTNAKVLVADEASESLPQPKIYDVYLEDGTSIIYCEEVEQSDTVQEENIDEETVTVSNYEVAAVAEPVVVETPKETTGKWAGYENVPDTHLTGDQADSCGLYQDNTLIKSHDEASKTIVLESGETFQYIYGDISHVTSYCPCATCCDTYTGYTHSGRYLLDEENPKVLAADTTRYPIGTVIFVPGYGIATVEDTGGAIDDRDLDIYIPDHGTAWNWGAVDTIVYIIAFGEW